MSDNAKTSGSGGLSAYDQLPPQVRHALAEFPLNMSAEFALEALRNGTSEARLLEMLAQKRSHLSQFNPENL